MLQQTHINSANGLKTQQRIVFSMYITNTPAYILYKYTYFTDNGNFHEPFDWVEKSRAKD